MRLSVPRRISAAPFSLNRNKLVDLYGDGKDDITSNLFIGKSLGAIYGYRTDGIFQSGENAGTSIFLTADGQQTANPSPNDRVILGYKPESFRMSLGIEMDPTAVPDTSQQFKLSVDKKISINKVSLTHDSQLLAINTDTTQPSLPECVFKPAPKPAPLDPSAFMTEDILSAGSEAKMAELSAKEIYDIRDSRNSLSRGEADNLPKDGAQLKLMYENMNRQEQALSQLFYGVTVKDTTLTQVEFMPTQEGRNVLFRFSKYYGLVAADDLSGTPYYITVTDLHTAVAPEVVDNKKEDKNDIGLRVCKPSKIKAVLSADGKTIDTYEMNAAQFGYTESLSGELFGKKQSSQIILDPLTGSVKSIKTIEIK